ncbi:acyltransferase family protein, partial [Enterobacter roggenkampii]
IFYDIIFFQLQKKQINRVFMFRNIQAMRAIAAILVVLYHFAPHFSIATGSNIPNLLFSKWAFFGVDIFFVISGFVIANS